MERPLITLPWPFSLLQPHTIVYAVYEGNYGGYETIEQKLARLEAENKKLKEEMEQRRSGELRLKASEKEECLEEKCFSRWRVNRAISLFLNGLPPEQKIMVFKD